MVTVGRPVLRAGAQMSHDVPARERFFVVDIANRILPLLAIYAAKWFPLQGDVAANAFGYSVGLLLSFALNSRWTIAYRGPHCQCWHSFFS